MLTVRDLLDAKGDVVHTIDHEASVLDAATKMNEHRIGSLVVTARGQLAGIITERDILTRVVAAQRPPAGTPVHQVMTSKVITCSPPTMLDELRKVMREKRIRHVPVLHAGQLCGMVSLGDLNNAKEEILIETIESLEAYIRSG